MKLAAPVIVLTWNNFIFDVSFLKFEVQRGRWNDWARSLSVQQVFVIPLCGRPLLSYFSSFAVGIPKKNVCLFSKIQVINNEKVQSKDSQYRQFLCLHFFSWQTSIAFHWFPKKESQPINIYRWLGQILYYIIIVIISITTNDTQKQCTSLFLFIPFLSCIYCNYLAWNQSGCPAKLHYSHEDNRFNILCQVDIFLCHYWVALGASALNNFKD